MADQAVIIGFWANAGLMVVKLLAGYFGKSEAVFADGLESACDFVVMLSAIIALRIGRKPFDHEHPYGHGKAESIAALLVSLVIFSTGGGILYKSIITIIDRNFERPQLIAVIAALATIVIKELLFRYTKNIADKIESPAVGAIAQDHRKDALTSIATLIGVSGAYFGAVFMDPLAAGITAFFIFHIGLETFRSASYDLMDGQQPEDLIEIVTAFAGGVEGVEHVHGIRARRSGQYVIVDLKLEMDANITVKHSHDIAAEVKRLIFERFPNVGDVMIHINPHEEEHEDMVRL